MKHKTAVVVSMLLTWLLSACIVVVILMAPTYLQKAHGIPASMALQANCLATITLMIGCVTVGMIVDRIGAGKTFIFGSILLAAGCAFFYLVAARDPSLLFLGYAVAGLCVGVVGAVPYVMVQAFPPEVRFSGISFSYNVSYAIFGGLTPISVTLMMQITPIAPAVYVLALSGLGLLLGLYLYQTQSRRRVALTESAQSL